MSYDVNIYTAFAAAVEAFAGAHVPTLPVAWPGVNFTPPQTGAWLEVAWFPNETVNLALGNDGSQLRGFGQVSCCVRPGAGIVSPLSIAEAVIAALPKGTALGVATVEKRPWASNVLVADDRISTYVTIRYSGGIAE